MVAKDNGWVCPGTDCKATHKSEVEVIEVTAQPAKTKIAQKTEPKPFVNPTVDMEDKQPTKKSDDLMLGDFAAIDNMPMHDLFDVSLSDLRSYAAKSLHIVGASKIAGGKSALIDTIMQHRKPATGNKKKK